MYERRYESRHLLKTNLREKYKKIRSVEWRYQSHYQNSLKNCFITQNFTEIGQFAAELWPKDDFQYGSHLLS